eukprot:1932715-Prymnesium_polylepis.1
MSSAKERGTITSLHPDSRPNVNALILDIAHQAIRERTPPHTHTSRATRQTGDPANQNVPDISDRPRDETTSLPCKLRLTP